MQIEVCVAVNVLTANTAVRINKQYIVQPYLMLMKVFFTRDLEIVLGDHSTEKFMG